MKRLALLLAVLVVAATACGGGGDNNGGAPQASGIPDSKDCKDRGIASDKEATGSCRAEDTAVRVANRPGRLRMKGHTVQVVGLGAAATLGRRAAQNFLPDGKFVVARLRVANTGTKPLRFDRGSNEVFLLVDGTEYQEVAGAEAQLRDSFAKAKAIPPGQSRTGRVVFVLPADHAKNAGGEDSYVVVLNSEDAGNGFPRVGLRSIGFVRLWK